MNGNFLYNTYSDKSFSPADDSSTSNDSNAAQRDAAKLSSLNPVRLHLSKSTSSIMSRRASNPPLATSAAAAAAAQRRPTMPLDFSGNQESLSNAMRRMSGVDYSQADSLNPYAFDPSLTGSGSMDPSMVGSMQQMDVDFQANANKHDADLSVDTQFANSMGFGSLGQNANFTSPLDMNMSQYMNSGGAMGMGMDLGMDMDMMGESMSGMNDLFNNQHFGSPILTSPMTTGFPQGMYGQVPNTSAGTTNASGQMMDDQTAMHNANFQMPPTSMPQALNAMPQPAAPPQNAHAKPNAMPPPSSASSGSSKRSQTSSLATIGSLTLPWSNPSGMSSIE
jgi:hypothetical protein